MRYAACTPLSITNNNTRQSNIPVTPASVVKDCTRLLKILIAEKAIRMINAVSSAVKGFFLLQKAREKNKPDSIKASNTIRYLRLLSAKMKNMPMNKNDPIIYKTVLATITALSALNNIVVRCRMRL